MVLRYVIGASLEALIGSDNFPALLQAIKSKPYPQEELFLTVPGTSEALIFRCTSFGDELIITFRSSKSHWMEVADEKCPINIAVADASPDGTNLWFQWISKSMFRDLTALEGSTKKDDWYRKSLVELGAIPEEDRKW